jgi:hypothetical protein
LSESEVSYQVPPDQTGFSAILMYPAQPRPVIGGAPYNVPVIVQVLVDGKVAWEQVMDGSTPPVEFSFPLRNASVLTIKSTAPFVGPTFYLVNAGFQSGAGSFSSYLVEAGTAFVDPMPEPRQAFVHAYYPGEAAQVRLAYGGAANEAEVQLTITPNWGDAPAIKDSLSVGLQAVKPGLVSGTAVWKAPSSMGPARMEISAVVGGKIVFRRSIDIDVIGEVDIHKIRDNDFGVGVSTAGYPLAYDEFAGLWGAKWARTFTLWSIVGANQGKYDFSRIDAVVDIYRSQGMSVMLALGEDAPAWVGYPGSDKYLNAWTEFVAETVRHMQGRVETWDVFNEVDNKVNTFQGKAGPDWDLAVLKTAISTIRGIDRTATIVCCSAGSVRWLQYNQRLMDAGVFSGVDVISLHPYQTPPPEEQEGIFNYMKSLAALKNIAMAHGLNKPIWGTEANWMLGAQGNLNVNAPGLSEQKQAAYLARVNMLSIVLGVKYFVHAPFYTDNHPQPQLPALAAFAQMSSMFSDVNQATMLLAGPSVFGINGASGSNRVGGSWTVSGPATIRLDGGENYRFMNMYGNAVTMTPESVQLSPDPVYYAFTGTTPRAQVLSQTSTQWTTLPRPSAWQCQPDAACTPTPAGLRVQSDISKYALQLASPRIAVSPNSCITVRLPIVTEKGSVYVAVMDEATRKTLQNRKVGVGQLPGVSATSVDLSVQTGSTKSINVIVTNANLTEAQSVFVMTAPAQIAPCLQ